MVVICIAPLAQHHHLVRNEFHAGVFLAFLVIPAAGLQASFDVDLLSLKQILLASFGKITPGDHIEPLGFTVTLTIGAVPRTADSHRKSGDWFTRRCVTHLWVFPKMPNDLNFIKASAHIKLLGTLQGNNK